MLSDRAQIAAMALQGILSVDISNQYKRPEEWVKCQTESAVQFADALIKELDKPVSGGLCSVESIKK
jgi:hypothetical protein